MLRVVASVGASGLFRRDAPTTSGVGVSDTPGNEARFGWPPTWYPAYRGCPQCGAGRLLVRDWWDDSPEHGGGCIGSQYKCADDDCDYWEDS